MAVFIIGAGGKIGQRLVALLAKNGDTPVAMYRSQAHKNVLDSMNSRSVYGDLSTLTSDELAALMAGCDAVVFTAGAGGKGIELTKTVDGLGLEKAIAAAKHAGISRFIHISAFPEAGRRRQTSESFEHYLTVKKRTDGYLSQTDLDWLIIRAGRLSDDIGTGLIQAGLSIEYAEITRDDVALTIQSVLSNPNLNKKIIEITQGSTPISQALMKLL